MANLLMQVIIPGDSALPEDNAVNNWHFGTSDLATATQNEILAALNDFYNTPVAPAVDSVGKFLSRFTNGAAATLRAYNMDDAKPRVPLYTIGFPIVVDTNDGLPREVAVVTSFEGLKQSGIPQARRRGRIYLGPVSTRAISAGANDMRVSLLMRDACNNAAFRMWQASNAAPLWSWGIYSAGARDNSDPGIPYEERPLKPVLFTPVHNGWTDDAVDIQRRRGTRPTTRFPWGTPQSTTLPA